MEPCGSPIIHVTFPRYIIEWLVVYKKRGRGADRAKSGPFHLVSRAVRQTTLRLITQPISSLVVTCFAAKALQQTWKNDSRYPNRSQFLNLAENEQFNSFESRLKI